MKNILIISYSYPPFNSIASRRWAKFSKQFAKNNYIVDVICSKNPYKKKSDWTMDIKHKNITVYELSNKWPKFSFKANEKKIFRILNKIFLILVNIFYEGNENDESRFWGKILKKKIKDLISKKNYEIVFATGPPYRVLYHSLYVKEINHKIKLYCDLRDEWGNGKLYRKITSDKKKNEEKIIKDYVLKKYDKILVTDNSNKEKIIQEFPKIKDKLVVVPHAIDLDEFSSNNISKPKNLNKISIIYGGNLIMINKEDSLIPFLDGLQFIKINNLEVYRKFEFSFYINSDWFYKEVNTRNLDIIKIYKKVEPRQFNKIASRYDYALNILPNHLKDYLITKNIDYLGLKKPILICSNEGKASKFITKNKIGYHINTSQEIVGQLIDFSKHNNNFPTNLFNDLLDRYSLETVSKLIFK